MESAANTRNPAIRRIMSEWKELKRNKSSQLTAHPLEDNLFEWHFTFRGAPDSDFEGGLYHGRILLPHNYPMKPPNIVFLTPNGRFEVGMKICLTVSAHHPETWQPSWSIRTVLTAIIGFMPSAGGGAIGSIDYEPAVRRQMAAESRAWRCNVCGSTNEEALPQDQEETELTASQTGDLSTSVKALIDERDAFPLGDIVIDKIERLDESRDRAPTPEVAAASSPDLNGLRRRNVNKDVAAQNNDNNEEPQPVPAPPQRAAAAAVPAAQQPAESIGATILDTSIAAIFFFILWIVLNKWII